MMKQKIPPVYSLWLLITAGLMIFIGISFSGEIKLGNHTLTKAYFPETLLAHSEPDKLETIFPADTLEIPADTLVEPDTTVHSLLIFGDSMTHHLARSVARYGSKNNYKVTGVTWESSSIPQWRNSGRIKEYLEASKPDYVLVVLGSNEMELKNFDRRIPDITAIAEELGDIPFVWIGPPLWKEDKGFYQALEKALPAEKIFKVETMEIERGKDLVHPTSKGADQWADSLMRWIRKSPHPILTELPDSTSTLKKHKFVYLKPDD